MFAVVDFVVLLGIVFVVLTRFRCFIPEVNQLGV